MVGGGWRRNNSKPRGEQMEKWEYNYAVGWGDFGLYCDFPNSTSGARLKRLDQIKNFCPSSRYLKCLMAATQASNSLSKVL